MHVPTLQGSAAIQSLTFESSRGGRHFSYEHSESVRGFQVCGADFVCVADLVCVVELILYVLDDLHCNYMYIILHAGSNRNGGG